MVQNVLTKAVVQRLKELGLPPSLIDIDVFRENFFVHRWIMLVRDGDEIANVHLVQPQLAMDLLRRELSDTRPKRRGR